MKKPDKISLATIMRLAIGILYALICFAGGCLVTIWIFHNPITPAGYAYFAVASCVVGAAASIFIVEERK